MLLWRSQKDDILNVAMNTLVMIVLLEYGGTLVAENPVSLPFSEMTCETHCLATSWRVVGRKENDRFPRLEVGEIKECDSTYD